MNKIKPLKKFGQNYLTDQNVLKKIADEISPELNDIVIEIGPGLGNLTRHLYGRSNKMYAFEIDTRVIENLQTEFPELILVNMDFLKADLTEIYNSEKNKLRVIGNVPYNITSPILFKLFESNTIVKDAVFLVQYEVAKRMTSQKGTKDWGILSVLLNYFGETKFCFKVSPNVFYPRPNVDSAVVHINFDDSKNDPEFNKLFIKIVKAAFGNRRKTLKNSLNNSIFKELDFSGCGIDLSLRAEQLDIEDFIRLTEYLEGGAYGRRKQKDNS